jgi:hypothetical protein
MDLPLLDEGQEVSTTELAPEGRFFRADHFIIHAGTFTGYGRTEGEAELAAWLLARAYLNRMDGIQPA